MDWDLGFPEGDFMMPLDDSFQIRPAIEYELRSGDFGFVRGDCCL